LTEPREVYEGFGEGFDHESESSALNLMNHPSYQELGDNKRRTRTRRSRIGINGANGKEEPRVIANPLAFANEQDLDLDREPELVATPEIPPPNLGKPSWTERAERTKVTKAEPVKPVVEPPEIRTVEMSLEEQDVFALMGISPLVKLEQETKNPKSVIINIVQPGQVPTKPTESISESPVVDKASSEVSAIKIPKPQEELVEKSFPQPVIEPSDLVIFADESEANSASTANRRRRRRSSALDADTANGEES
jgi:ribonuclease E